MIIAFLLFCILAVLTVNSLKGGKSEGDRLRDKIDAARIAGRNVEVEQTEAGEIIACWVIGAVISAICVIAGAFFLFRNMPIETLIVGFLFLTICIGGGLVNMIRLSKDEDALEKTLAESK